MLNSQKLLVKVCGMREEANIQDLVNLKPDYIGFIFYPNSLRYAGALKSEIFQDMPSHIKKTGVFVNETITEVVSRIKELGLNAIQLHGAENAEYCKGIKGVIGNVELIKAFGIDADFDFTALEPYLNVIDYFLFDTKTLKHGGSGKTFNWSLLDQYPYDKKYFLSGGIDISHVEYIQEINDLRLYAIDINSCFEVEPGMKDINKVSKFINELKDTNI